jgi:hypothetical protein
MATSSEWPFAPSSSDWLSVPALGRLGLACLLVACAGRSERLDARDRDGQAGGGGGRGVDSPVCGTTGGRASVGFEIRFEDRSQRITYLVERDDGSLIAHRSGKLLRIELDGSVSELALAPALEAALSNGEAVELAPRGQAALVSVSTSERLVFDLYQASLLSSFHAPNELDILGSEFSASGNLIVTTYGELGLDRQYPYEVDVRALDGSVRATSPYRGDRNPRVPASDDRIVWPPGSRSRTLLVTAMDQTELYSVDVPSEGGALRISDDGRVIGMHLYGNEIWHLIDGVLLPPYLPDAAASELSLAPGGDWTTFRHAAPARIHLMESGQWRVGSAVALEFVDSGDVSDHGDVVLGGEAENGERRVLLLDANLELKFVCAAAPSASYGPNVRFSHDGRRVIALFDDRLSVFGVH